jgi:hypothetical protein
MMKLVIAAAAVLIAAAGSEFMLRGVKVQTALTRVLAIWIVSYAAAALWLARQATAGLAAVTIFCSGAFLVWFGVRSHLESSILLRMLFLLRNGPMSDLQLVDEYLAVHSESMRIAELCRGGLVAEGRDEMRVTAKGKVILTFASKLR